MPSASTRLCWCTLTVLLITHASFSFPFTYLPAQRLAYYDLPNLNMKSGSAKYHNRNASRAATNYNLKLRTRKAQVHDTSMTTTSLYSSPSSISPSVDSILALSTIVLSTTIGHTSARFKFLKSISGVETVIALVVAAFISNFGLFGIAVPLSHSIYDVCWSRFLPASLAFVLLSTSSKDVTDNGGDAVENFKETRKEVITAVSIPFIIGSIGSIIGCTVSAMTLIRFGNKSIGNNALSFIGMMPYEAAIAAGQCTDSWKEC